MIDYVTYAVNDLERNNPQHPRPDTTRFFSFSGFPVDQATLKELDKKGYPIGSTFLLFSKEAFSKDLAWAAAKKAMDLDKPDLSQRNPFRKAHTRLYWAWVIPGKAK